jgi:hypothetical protein
MPGGKAFPDECRAIEARALQEIKSMICAAFAP